MSRRALCKFFANGACLKGEHCEFAHDWKAPPNNICSYYQKGACAYGSRCRYAHVKFSESDSSTSCSSTSAGSPTSETIPISMKPLDVIVGGSQCASTSIGISPNKSSRTHKPEKFCDFNYDYVGSVNIHPSDRAVCSFATAGNCPGGDKCPYIHGDVCSSCQKRCLHPFRLDEREKHIKACEKKQKYIKFMKYSQEIECCVCLEHVLLKPSAAERKFGLLSECDHPFCISCIRNWRSSSPTSGMDVNSALRSCPICRKLSYFVIPSAIWFATKEEKQEIIDSYKSRLKSIDCKYFDFGCGSCPFDSGCFYKHAYHDGSLEEEVPHHVGPVDSDALAGKDTRISELLSSLRLR